MDWITSDDESASMMVLRGSAGLGKSALEQSVAEKCRKHGLYAAGFFFSTTSSNRNNGDTLIPTLVRQLMQVIPGLRELVEKELENDPHLFKLSREAQMERLLVKHIQITAPPISPTTPKPSRIKRIFSRQKPRTSSTQAPSMDSRSTRQPRLVAIDGFDECNDQTIQHDLLLILASALTRLHYPFRFLIATRPESHIVQILQHHPSFQCGAVLHVNLNDTNADDDILFLPSYHVLYSFSLKYDEFLSSSGVIRRLPRTHPVGRYLVPSWPTEEDVDTLVRKASSQFIYASTVMNFLSSPEHRPDDRLQVILGLSAPQVNETPFSQLDGLYTHIFSSIKREDLDTVNRILGIIVLAADDMAEITPCPCDLDEVFSFRPGDIELVLIPLASVISVSAPEEPVEVLHASLMDFLLDPARSGIFALDITLAHDTLAKWNWRNIDFGVAANWSQQWNITVDNIGYFLRHALNAHLSNEIVDMLHPVSKLLGDMLADEPEVLVYQKVGDALIRLGEVFDRTDIISGLQMFDFETAVVQDKEAIKKNLQNMICTARFLYCGHWIRKKPTNFSLGELASSYEYTWHIVLLAVRGPVQARPTEAPLLRQIPPELVEHQKVVDKYRREVLTYLERVKHTLPPAKLEMLKHLYDDSDEYWRERDMH
ncbi:hypothetical protein NLJ89_g3796 [Agrocybe chaxingu]|uniref:Nephrocystin 3-like N-terminal domain-containing protein n=1 Tax=Agrocybe chaxingu TaxID=84603 RepID=A0A9W8K526_9AGAR|nr:hypothetical protein NLJ89_g3796 [Agrocybe chaxingu]